MGYTSERAAALFIFFKHFKKLVSNSCRAPFGNFENVKQIVRSEAESICGRVIL